MATIREIIEGMKGPFYARDALAEVMAQIPDANRDKLNTQLKKLVAIGTLKKTKAPKGKQVIFQNAGELTKW